MFFRAEDMDHLSMEKEGFKVARWLNALGITVVVLKYRLPSDEIMEDKTIGPLQDAQEAVRVVRRNAYKWKIDVNKIGIIGFSAGGHLAATLSTRYLDNLYNAHDTISARPNFSMLIYPVISMKEGITHQGSRGNLLGKTPSDLLIKKFSLEAQVNSLTPPTFMAHASDDTSVPVENSIMYYQALIKHKVPAELHLYEKGGSWFWIGCSRNQPELDKTCRKLASYSSLYKRIENDFGLKINMDNTTIYASISAQ